MTVPNGPPDTATFAISNTTVDGISFDPGASSFTITADTGGGTFKEGGQTIFFNTQLRGWGFHN
jgi:hypothetical protein